MDYYVSGSAVNSYATVAPETGEDHINSLYLLFFEHSSGGTGKFIEAIDLTDPNGPMTNIGSIEVVFPSGTKLIKNKAYNMLIVANIENYLNTSLTGMDPWIDYLEGKTENDVISGGLISIVGQKWDDVHDNNQSILQNSILMSAILSKEAGQQNVNVELIRAVARFDVTNNASGYTLVSASIWNAFPKTSVWESKFSDFSLDRANRFYGVDAENNEVKGGLYAFENYVNGCAQDDEKTTCVILGLVDDSDLSQQVMYYRVNINATNYGQQIKRNNAYSIKITRVKGNGEANEASAWNSKEILLDTSINEWTVDNQGNIQYDGENILAVPISSIAFGYEAETREYTIFTLGEGTLEISKTMLDHGLSAELDGKVLKVSCTSSVESRGGTIELRFGNLKSSITITQTMKNNLYLDLSVKSVPTFPNTASAGTEEGIKVMSSGPWTAKIYNGGFTFWYPNDKTEHNGTDGEVINIYTKDANNDNVSHYAFVHITLDEDPEISRTLVLTQKGQGGIDINPSKNSYDFHPTGKTTEGPYTYKYLIGVAADTDWEVIKNAGDDAFTVFDVTSSGFSVSVSENLTVSDRSASYRVRLVDSPSVYHDIMFRQDEHSLIITPTTVPKVPSEGGVSNSVQVASSKDWDATLVSNTGTVEFLSGGTTITSQASGTSFAVVFPAIESAAVIPSATIRVTIPNTPIWAEIIIDQKRMLGDGLKIISYDPNYGSLSGTAVGTKEFDIFVGAWKNAASFGPNGTVYVPSFTWAYGYNNTIINNPPADIFVFNNTTGTGGSSNQLVSMIKDWQAGADNRFVMLHHHSSNAPWNLYVGVGTSKGVTISSGDKRTLYSGSANTKLMKYLLEDGPFTKDSPIDISDVALYSSLSNNNVVTDFPATMIPLIMNPKNSKEMLLGIDPVLRVFFLGDLQMFSTSTTQSASAWKGTQGDNNYKFLNNMLAWLTYAAQFGEDFIGDYK